MVRNLSDSQKKNIKKTPTNIFKKVVFVGPNPDGGGGMSAVMAEYKKAFKEATVLATNSTKGRFAGLVRFGVSMLRLPIERLKGRKILHIHYAGGKSWERKKVVVRLGRLFGYKLIMHCHTDLEMMTQVWCSEAEASSILSKGTGNIVLGNIYRDFAVNNLKLANVVLVDNPISFTGKRKDASASPVTFLFLGVLTHDKGAFDLVEAARILKEEGLRFKINMCGAGKGETEVRESIARYGLEDTVILPGWVKGDDKLRIFEDSHVFVLPSYTEGMPMSILEAKCAAMPSISTKVGGIPDIIEDGKDGYLFEPGDVEELASAMRQFIVNPGLIEKTGSAAKESSIRFDIGSIRKELEKQYESVL